MKRPVNVRGALVACVSILLVVVAGSSAFADRSYTFYAENSASNRGVHAHWTDEGWTNIPCPQNIANENRVSTFVNIIGNDALSWIQFGYKDRKYYTNQCVSDRSYYWEWSAFQTGDYNKGYIDSPQPLGTHVFVIQRLTTGCAVGASWCWHQRMDSVTKHTCCFLPEFSYGLEVSVQTECVDDVENTDCPASGLVNTLDEFTYKTTSDNWVDWSGRIDRCVDYDRSARGKWLTDTSSTSGYNVSFTGSSQVLCQ